MQWNGWLWIGIWIWCACTGRAGAQDLYERDRVIEVRIQIDRSDWRDVLDSLKSAKIKKRLVADVWVEGVRYREAGVRYKGNSSYNSVSRKGKEKLPFNIKIDHRHKDQALPGGYTTLKLSNIFRDPSFMREVLAYEIAGRYMPAPRANFAQVYINDEYYGLYHSTESIDERFLEHYFGYGEGILFKCDPEYSIERPPYCPPAKKRASLQYQGDDPSCYQDLYELKSDTGWTELIALIHRLNKKPESIEEVLDVDQTLWMLAFDNCIVNLDSYLGEFCHNYYLYRDTAGMFHPIVWDMNLAFGGFRLDGLGNRLSLNEMQELSMFLHYKQKNEDRPLITRLFAQDLYRKVYVAHIRTILEDVFLSGLFEERVRQLHEHLQPLVEKDENKLYPLEAFYRNLNHTADADGVEIVGVLELMKPRVNYLKDHPLMQKNPPVFESVRVRESEDGEAYRFTAETRGAVRVWLMVRDGPYANFRRLAMDSEGEGTDRWSMDLPAAGDTQYYFIAEGESNASLLPAQASFRVFTLSEQLEKQ